MAPPRTDKTGAPVEVRLERSGQFGSYVVSRADDAVAGRADFIETQGSGHRERIFFHTEVDPHLAGRGLARLLVEEALADSIRSDVGVVPVCPLFAAHLTRRRDEFVSRGGVFRRPSPDDLVIVSRLVRDRSERPDVRDRSERPDD